MSNFNEINVLAYQEGEDWVAQCVDRDIYARARGLPELPEALGRAIAANVCANAELGGSGLDGIKPAPARFRHAFESAGMPVKGWLMGIPGMDRININWRFAIAA